MAGGRGTGSAECKKSALPLYYLSGPGTPSWKSLVSILFLLRIQSCFQLFSDSALGICSKIAFSTDNMSDNPVDLKYMLISLTIGVFCLFAKRVAPQNCIKVICFLLFWDHA